MEESVQHQTQSRGKLQPLIPGLLFIQGRFWVPSLYIYTGHSIVVPREPLESRGSDRSISNHPRHSWSQSSLSSWADWPPFSQRKSSKKHMHMSTCTRRQCMHSECMKQECIASKAQALRRSGVLLVALHERLGFVTHVGHRVPCILAVQVDGAHLLAAVRKTQLRSLDEADELPLGFQILKPQMFPTLRLACVSGKLQTAFFMTACTEKLGAQCRSLALGVTHSCHPRSNEILHMLR